MYTSPYIGPIIGGTFFLDKTLSPTAHWIDYSVGFVPYSKHDYIWISAPYTRVSREDAQKYCEFEEGNLLYFETEEDWKIVNDHLKKMNNKQDYWTGILSIFLVKKTF